MVYKRVSFLVISVFLLKFILISLYDFAMPSEARYAAISMRMLLNNNYLMPYFSPDIPFFGKPPLAFWASAISMKVFGMHYFAARLPHLLALLATCMALYVTVKRSYDYRTGIAAVVILLSCAISYALSSVMTEAFLLLGMTMTLLSFWAQIQSDKQNIHGYLFFLGCVISVLTKGPVGICFPGLSIFVYLIISGRWKEFFTKFPLIKGGLLFFVLALPWFFLAERKYPGFLDYFILGENWHRFATPGWRGDRYGHAHLAYFGQIWVFFVVLILPVGLIFLVKSKQIFLSFLQLLARDKSFVFFALSFLVSMGVLTFMRNMIGTYVIYSIIPFTILLSRIILVKKWDNIILYLAYLTLIAHLFLIAAFAVNPALFTKHSEYDVKLLKQIPNYPNLDGSEVYYVGNEKNTFLLAWYTKDKIRAIDSGQINNIVTNSNSSNYFIGDKSLQDHYKILKPIACVEAESNSNCLYYDK